MTHPAGLAVVCVAALTCDPLALVTLTTQDTLTSLQTRSEGAHVCLEQIKHVYLDRFFLILLFKLVKYHLSHLSYLPNNFLFSSKNIFLT